jgi:hypothetical protein
LLKQGKLQKLDLRPEDAKKLALGLAEAGEDGQACLRWLLDAGKLQNLRLQGVELAEVKTKVLELLNEGSAGLEELKKLLEQSAAPVGSS